MADRRSRMRVQLIRKLAAMIDGVDLTHSEVGDLIELPARDARLLIAEGWAVPTGAEMTSVARPRRAEAADRPSRRPPIRRI